MCTCICTSVATQRGVKVKCTGQMIHVLIFCNNFYAHLQLASYILCLVATLLQSTGCKISVCATRWELEEEIRTVYEAFTLQTTGIMTTWAGFTTLRVYAVHVASYGSFLRMWNRVTPISALLEDMGWQPFSEKMACQSTTERLMICVALHAQLNSTCRWGVYFVSMCFHSNSQT